MASVATSAWEAKRVLTRIIWMRARSVSACAAQASIFGDVSRNIRLWRWRGTGKPFRSLLAERTRSTALVAAATRMSGSLLRPAGNPKQLAASAPPRFLRPCRVGTRAATNFLRIQDPLQGRTGWTALGRGAKNPATRLAENGPLSPYRSAAERTRGQCEILHNRIAWGRTCSSAVHNRCL